jgi:hypothetical protein
VLEVLLEWHSKRRSQIDEINERPLYPNEKVLWDPNLVPSGGQGGQKVMMMMMMMMMMMLMGMGMMMMMGMVMMMMMINERPLYPNEKVLWDPNLVPSGGQGGQKVMMMMMMMMMMLMGMGMMMMMGMMVMVMMMMMINERPLYPNEKVFGTPTSCPRAAKGNKR